MKKLLKWTLALFAILALLVGGALLYIDRTGIPQYPTGRIELRVDVTLERVERGRRTVDMLCSACHLDNDSGTLAGKPMADLPPQFGKAHSANITRDAETGIGSWTDGEIAYLLRTGVTPDGRYTPPWMERRTSRPMRS